MRPEELLEILQQAGKLKTTYRHCYTENDRRESTADHSWRIALMAMLLEEEGEFRDMISSGIGNNVNVIIQTMGTREWQDYDISSDTAQTYKIEDGKLKLVR
ncbi:MAG: HD domain-containing protein, partial [Solobacterium sp.]|nr:HD domain-containing protein [Solobacterium sp.]